MEGDFGSGRVKISFIGEKRDLILFLSVFYLFEVVTQVISLTAVLAALAASTLDNIYF